MIFYLSPTDQGKVEKMTPRGRGRGRGMTGNVNSVQYIGTLYHNVVNIIILDVNRLLLKFCNWNVLNGRRMHRNFVTATLPRAMSGPVLPELCRKF